MELHQAIEDTAGKRRFPHRLFVAEHPMHILLHCEGQKPRQHSASKRIVSPCRLVTDTFDILSTLGICVYAIYHGTGKATIQCVITFQTFVCLPNYILTTAHNYSAIGVSSYNDAPDLPAYFYPLLFVVSTFSGMVKICVTLFEVYTLYYMYQTICIRQKERKR